MPPWWATSRTRRVPHSGRPELGGQEDGEEGPPRDPHTSPFQKTGQSQNLESRMNSLGTGRREPVMEESKASPNIECTRQSPVDRCVMCEKRSPGRHPPHASLEEACVRQRRQQSEAQDRDLRRGRSFTKMGPKEGQRLGHRSRPWKKSQVHHTPSEVFRNIRKRRHPPQSGLRRGGPADRS